MRITLFSEHCSIIINSRGMHIKSDSKNIYNTLWEYYSLAHGILWRLFQLHKLLVSLTQRIVGI